MNTTSNEQPLYSALASDPDLREIVELFVMEMPDRVSSLRSQYEQRDFEELRRTAHQLKGAAGSYGFSEISPCAAHLEDMLNASEPEDKILETLEDLISLCGRVTAEEPV